jgi:hypothetical protein
VTRDSDNGRLLLALAARRAAGAVEELAHVHRLLGRAAPSLRVVDAEGIVNLHLDDVVAALADDADRIEKAITRE